MAHRFSLHAHPPKPSNLLLLRNRLSESVASFEPRQLQLDCPLAHNEGRASFRVCRPLDSRASAARPHSRARVVISWDRVRKCTPSLEPRSASIRSPRARRRARDAPLEVRRAATVTIFGARAYAPRDARTSRLVRTMNARKYERVSLDSARSGPSPERRNEGSLRERQAEVSRERL